VLFQQEPEDTLLLMHYGNGDKLNVVFTSSQLLSVEQKPQPIVTVCDIH